MLPQLALDGLLALIEAAPLSPQALGAPPSGTLEGERGSTAGILLSLEEAPSGGGTLEGERGPLAGIALPAPAKAPQRSGTLEGERGPLLGISLPGPAIREGGGTFEGERGAEVGISLGAAGSALELPSGTLEGQRAPSAGISLREAPSPLGTLEGERASSSQIALQPSGEGLILPGAEPLPAGDLAERRNLLDLSLLSAEHQQALQDAQVSRAGIRLGFVTWDQARESWGQAPSGTEWLVAQGILDPMQSMHVFGESQEEVSISSLTLQVQTGHRPGTLLQGRGEADAQTVEGFPGVGGTFAGHEIQERLAEGAMGVVFLARQVKLNRTVALKVMRGGALASASRKRRFLNEAEAAAALIHPAIVPVHEIGEVNGYPFYTMDYIEGATLDVHVRDESSTPRQVASLMQVLSEGVQHFHQHGIIHRDLKPENVLVSNAGPRIIDFGIAKRIDEDATGGTVDGALVGTPAYMAPEQAAGRVREVDIRTDVYALGVIAYELLSGQAPFVGSNAAIVLAIQQEDPKPLRSALPGLDRDLAAIVEMAMAKEPERRYQSAAAYAADLERYLTDLPVRARPATLVYRLRKVVRRRLPAVLALCVCLVALTASGGYLLWRSLARQARVADLLLRAEGEALSDEDREDLLTQALTLDEDSQVARTRREALRERRAAGKRLRDRDAKLREQSAKLEAQQAERRAEQAQADLARERAEREAVALKEQERARNEAEAQARSAAETRARGLLARSREREQDPLAAIADASDALVLLPQSSGDVTGDTLRAQVEARKLELGLRLVDEALEREEIGMVRFWLRETRKLGVAQVVTSVRSQVASRQERMQRLLSGEGHLREAKRLAQAGSWLAARERLESAAALGLRPETLAAERRVIEARCRQRSTEFLDEGQKSLAQGDAAGALTRARRALEFAPSDPARALAAEAERELVQRARRDAAILFERSETRARALSQLELAERLAQPALARDLRDERRARAALLTESLTDLLVLIPHPEGEELSSLACVQRREVTNAEFQEFVKDQGYADDSLWSAETPPGVRLRGAPLTWRGGLYGDSSNARRPVRGVTVHEARAYASWRSRRSEARWRLPTAREWEISAGWDPTTGAYRRFPWGASLGPWTTTGLQQPPEVGTDTRDRSALGVEGLGGGVLEWVESPEGPRTKGASWIAPRHLAERYAQVKISGSPGATPPRELLSWIGLRLVREAKP